MDKKELKNKIQEYCNNKIICWIALIIFAPLGFIMTAMNKTFKPVIKGIILFIFAFIALYEILVLVSAGGNKLVAFANGDNKPKTEQITTKPIKKVEAKKGTSKTNDTDKPDSILEQIKNGTYKPNSSDNKIEKVTFKTDSDYRNFTAKATELFSKDSNNVVSAIDNKNYSEIKDLGKFVVEDCNYIESAVPPEKFKSVQDKLNQACEIYKPIYGQLGDKIQANDNSWIEQQTENIKKGTDLMNEATKEAEKIINN